MKFFHHYFEPVNSRQGFIRAEFPVDFGQVFYLQDIIVVSIQYAALLCNNILVLNKRGRWWNRGFLSTAIRFDKKPGITRDA